MFWASTSPVPDDATDFGLIGPPNTVRSVSCPSPRSLVAWALGDGATSSNATDPTIERNSRDANGRPKMTESLHPS